MRGKAQEIRAAGAFFRKLSRLEYLAELEGGKIKMGKQQRKDLESGKLRENISQAAQEVWSAYKDLPSEDILRLVKADRFFGKLIGISISSALGLIGIASALFDGAAYMTYTLAAGAIANFALMFPWGRAGKQAEQMHGTIESAGKRAGI